jgi:cell division protein FtsL
LERRQQEDVRVEIASLESPMRIEKIAADELKMNQVTQAEYLMTPGFIEANTPVADEMSSEEAMVSEATQGVDRQN